MSRSLYLGLVPLLALTACDPDMGDTSGGDDDDTADSGVVDTGSAPSADCVVDRIDTRTIDVDGGDEVTLSLDCNDPVVVATVRVRFADQEPQITVAGGADAEGNGWTGTFVTEAADKVGAVGLEVSVTDDADVTTTEEVELRRHHGAATVASDFALVRSRTVLRTAGPLLSPVITSFGNDDTSSTDIDGDDKKDAIEVQGFEASADLSGANGQDVTLDYKSCTVGGRAPSCETVDSYTVDGKLLDLQPLARISGSGGFDYTKDIAVLSDNNIQIRAQIVQPGGTSSDALDLSKVARVGSDVDIIGGSTTEDAEGTPHAKAFFNITSSYTDSKGAVTHTVGGIGFTGATPSTAWTETVALPPLASLLHKGVLYTLEYSAEAGLQAKARDASTGAALSTTAIDGFDGTPVGDRDGDGVPGSVLDAELAALGSSFGLADFDGDGRADVGLAIIDDGGNLLLSYAANSREGFLTSSTFEVVGGSFELGDSARVSAVSLTGDDAGSIELVVSTNDRGFETVLAATYDPGDDPTNPDGVTVSTEVLGASARPFNGGQTLFTYGSTLYGELRASSAPALYGADSGLPLQDRTGKGYIDSGDLFGDGRWETTLFSVTWNGSTDRSLVLAEVDGYTLVSQGGEVNLYEAVAGGEPVLVQGDLPLDVRYPVSLAVSARGGGNAIRRANAAGQVFVASAEGSDPGSSSGSGESRPGVLSITEDGVGVGYFDDPDLIRVSLQRGGGSTIDYSVIEGLRNVDSDGDGVADALSLDLATLADSALPGPGETTVLPLSNVGTTRSGTPDTAYEVATIGASDDDGDRYTYAYSWGLQRPTIVVPPSNRAEGLRTAVSEDIDLSTATLLGDLGSTQKVADLVTVIPWDTGTACPVATVWVPGTTSSWSTNLGTAIVLDTSDNADCRDLAVPAGVGDADGDGQGWPLLAALDDDAVRLTEVVWDGGSIVALPSFGFTMDYTGGVNVAVGDVNGDGFDDVVMSGASSLVDSSGGTATLAIFSGGYTFGGTSYDPTTGLHTPTGTLRNLGALGNLGAIGSGAALADGLDPFGDDDFNAFFGSRLVLREVVAGAGSGTNPAGTVALNNGGGSKRKSPIRRDQWNDPWNTLRPYDWPT